MSAKNLRRDRQFCGIFSPRGGSFYRTFLKELVDNALSANAGDVAVYLRQEDWHQYQLEVIDNGEGIAEERLSEVFGCGRAKPQKLGRYNRFGIGLKTVLVNCDPKDKAWEMITKIENGTALRVAAPYRDSVMQYEASLTR